MQLKPLVLIPAAGVAPVCCFQAHLSDGGGFLLIRINFCIIIYLFGGIVRFVSTFALYWVEEKLLSPGSRFQWCLSQQKLCWKSQHDLRQNFSNKSLQRTWTKLVALVSAGRFCGWLLPLNLWLVHSYSQKKLEGQRAGKTSPLLSAPE